MAYMHMTKPEIGEAVSKLKFADTVIDNLDYLYATLNAAEISNPSFELADASGLPVGWTATQRADLVALDNTVTLHGRASLKLRQHHTDVDPTPTAPALATDPARLESAFFPVTGGSQLAVGVSYQSTVDILGAVSVSFYDANQSAVTPPNVIVLNASEVQASLAQVDPVKVDVPSTARLAKVVLLGPAGQSATPASVYFDRIVVAPMETKRESKVLLQDTSFLEPEQAISKQFADNTFLKLAGGTVSGNIQASSLTSTGSLNTDTLNGTNATSVNSVTASGAIAAESVTVSTLTPATNATLTAKSYVDAQDLYSQKWVTGCVVSSGATQILTGQLYRNGQQGPQGSWVPLGTTSNFDANDDTSFQIRADPGATKHFQVRVHNAPDLGSRRVSDLGSRRATFGHFVPLLNDALV